MYTKTRIWANERKYHESIITEKELVQLVSGVFTDNTQVLKNGKTVILLHVLSDGSTAIDIINKA